MEPTINAGPPEQDMDMQTTESRPLGDVPWYQLRSSIVMITLTIVAFSGLVLDYAANDQTPVQGYRIVENGTIVGGARGDSFLR
jgi:hypothetical protein